MWANIKTDTDQLDQVFDLDGFFLICYNFNCSVFF